MTTVRTFDEAPVSTSLPPNFAWKRTREAVRFLNVNVALYSHVRVSVTRLVEISFVPRLAENVIVPLQPCEGATGSGRVILPSRRNAYGALRSRLGRSVSVMSLAAKRRTVIARTALAVWPAPSEAIAISVLRPMSPPRGW